MTLFIESQTTLDDGRTVCIVEDDTDAEWDAYLTREQADEVVASGDRKQAEAFEQSNMASEPGWIERVDAIFAQQSEDATREGTTGSAHEQ